MEFSAQTERNREEYKDWVAERVGFEPLNAGRCTALHDLVRTRERKHLFEFQFPLGLIDSF